jgi:hypothetical protein
MDASGAVSVTVSGEAKVGMNAGVTKKIIDSTILFILASNFVLLSQLKSRLAGVIS